MFFDKRHLANRRLVAAATALSLLFTALSCLADDKRPDIKTVADPGLAMKDVDGKERHPLLPGEDKASVLIFVLPDCPIANAYAPEIRRMTVDYKNKPVRFALVYVDPDLKPGDIGKHRKEYGHDGCSAYFDKDFALANATAADVTPEAVVIAGKGRIAYRGRISNLYADYGKRRRKATQHDLRDAIDALLAGKPVTTPRTEALGCFIPRPN